MTLGTRLAVAAKPAVLRLMTAGLISGIGDWLLTIALPIYVYALTRSTLSSATTMVLELVAALVCGQFAGLVVDRFDRRGLLVLTNLAQAALLLPLLIPSLVEADELVRANTLISTGSDLAKLIGAAGAGVVLGVVGLGGVVAVDALSFVAAALLLALRFPVSSAYVPRPPDGKTRFQRWSEGLALVRRTPPLRNAFVILVINQLAQGIALALIVAFFVEDLHRGSAAVGVFRSFQVVGTIPAGILVAVYASKRRPESLLKASLLAGAVIEFFIWNGPSITHWFGYYLILEVLLGLPGVTAFIAFSTILQTATPREFLGRVFSLLGALSSSALLLSVLAGGSLGEFLTPRILLNGTVALEALTGVAAVMLFRTPPEK